MNDEKKNSQEEHQDDDAEARRRSGGHGDSSNEEVDEAVDETFPASDPPSYSTPKLPRDGKKG